MEQCVFIHLTDGNLTIQLPGCVEVSTPGVGWSWGSTLTPNYGGLGGGGGLELSNSATS